VAKKREKPGKDAHWWKKFWWFVWEDESIWSWIVNVLLAFLLIKFIVYPGLGLIFATSHPIVAVVSGSMTHDEGFDQWWMLNSGFYERFGITKEEFKGYPFRNGFKRGDIMVLFGRSSDKVEQGDVLVFRSGRPDPIIHRVIRKWEEPTGTYFQTKGDHNYDSISSPDLNELRVGGDQAIGIAVLRIPYLGYIKIWFVDLLSLLHII